MTRTFGAKHRFDTASWIRTFRICVCAASFFDLTNHSLFAKIKLVSQELAIEWSMKAVRDMRRIAHRDGVRIIAEIEQYADDPGLLGNQVITLAGSRYMRLRVGDHRVIFNVGRGDTASMVVLRVRHMREIYD